jgi:hypothetical protein
MKLKMTEAPHGAHLTATYAIKASTKLGSDMRSRAVTQTQTQTQTQSNP